MVLVTLSQVAKNLGQRLVLQDISLAVNEAEILVIMGPSGCGKTTLLKIIAGDIPPDEGTVKHWKPDYSQSVGFILQRLNVFPWLTVRQNIAFGLKRSRRKNDDDVEKIMHSLDLSDSAEYYPAELSGGMAQRVAIARTLVLRPQLVLMDEPFTGLDYARRRELHRLVHKMQDQMRTSIVLVTHDIEDALRLGDRIIVLKERPGQIQSEFKGVQTMTLHQRMEITREFLDD
jgi:ABC-type nitrate/sulfonate/bicarbonate transport system ATPase subunit